MRLLRTLRTAATALLATTPGCFDHVPSGPSVGQLRVIIATTGGDLDLAYELVVGPVRRAVPVNGTVYLNINPGDYQVTLGNVAANCILSGSATQAVEVERDETAIVRYTVECAVTGIEVTVQTTGLDTPDSYVAQVGSSTLSVPINGSVTFGRLQPGTHSVFLRFPGPNCHAMSDPAPTATVQNRSVSKVGFTVQCVAAVRAERIAYVDYTSPVEASWSVVITSPDGSDTKSLWAGHSPSWSPDGTKLVYTDTFCDWYYGCTGALLVADPEVHSSRILQDAFHATSPAWSPKGDLIAFTSVAGTSKPSSLFTITASGNQLTAITIDGVQSIENPSWSPDGNMLAFTCFVGDSQNPDICVSNLSGSAWKRLTSSAFPESDPAWSPDGSRIAFVTFEGNSTGSIATIGADGSDKKVLTGGFSPSWSRNGSQIVFATPDGIFTIKADGTALTRLTTGRHRDPVWRP